MADLHSLSQSPHNQDRLSPPLSKHNNSITTMKHYVTAEPYHCRHITLHYMKRIRKARALQNWVADLVDF